MRFTSIALTNWRNFQSVPVTALSDRIFLIGPNAAGKSNFLDVFRYLRDVSEVGLAEATRRRGGISSIRCLSARKVSDISITVEAEVDGVSWKYGLTVNQDNKQRPIVKRELIQKNGVTVDSVNSPSTSEVAADPDLLQYTRLEQPIANREFRSLAELFHKVSYQHVVPQLVRDPRGFSPMPVLYDPFGRDFLVRVWKTAPRTRSSRLEKIAKALQVAVPQFKSIGINADELGVPHLEVEYEHWRAISAKQSERDLSDGTLRLIGFMWSLYEGDGPVLLEEPEGSLHKEIVRKLVTLLDTVNRSRRTRRQFIISTHSEDLLMNPTVAAEEVLRFEPAKNGTQIVLANEVDKHRMKEGLTAADVLLPQSSPRNVDQLASHL